MKNMDESDPKDIITKWADDNAFLLEISQGNKYELKHSVIDVSFYVFTEDNSNEWNIWTDSDDVIPYMQEIIDGPCNQKSLIDILNRTKKVLSKLLPSASKDDSDASSGVGEDCSDLDDDDDDDGHLESYYNDEDRDALMDTETQELHQEDSGADRFFTGDGSPVAVQRLVKDMKALNQSNGKFGVVGQPRGDNLFIWDVKLTDFDPKSQLGKDLESFAKKHKREPVVYMELKFPKDYPMEPPFARVKRPRFKFLTGHITIGGSICMEMLTKSGWRPINDIESILVQIRSEIISDPNARLESNCDNEYNEHEAKQAFERTVQRYGWNN